MDISLTWLNKYLHPGGVTAAEADHLLTEAGFPLDGMEARGDDTILDVEVTSNRGDCLSHVGCAREVAAVSQARAAAEAGSARVQTLTPPSIADPAPGAPIGDELTLENRVKSMPNPGCPRFTARLIRNVKIGPSPDWLREALESVGARSINNVVDVTNFITFAVGNPCHVFDHAKLAGGALIVRHAEPGERVKTLYEGEHELRASDLVVADAERPQSLAGVIGGYDSQVDEGTTTVVFEMATWDPVTVRNTARRTNIRTDAAYRFERTIDPRTIDDAARLAVALICEVSGGELADGVLDDGAGPWRDHTIELRPERCAQVLGIETTADEIADLLTPLGIGVSVAGGVAVCTVPAHRAHDLTREIDLIEEVGRMRGLGVVPISEKVGVVAKRPQASEVALREIAALLAGLGYYECVTFSFTSPARGQLFLAPGEELVSIDDERRGAEPTLRPSVLTGLLATRANNQSARNQIAGGVRLFEKAAVFSQAPGTRDTHEHRSLALLADVAGSGKKIKTDDRQRAVREMRGVVDAIVRACFGPEAGVVVLPLDQKDAPKGWGQCATLAVEAPRGTLDGLPGRAPGANTGDRPGGERPGFDRIAVGIFGLVSDEASKAFDLDGSYVAAELALEPIVAAYPPRALAHALPQFPGIERDVSLIVDETTPWASVGGVVDACTLDKLVGYEMVGVFRGEQVGAGKKSVTVRLRFRDDERTLRHEEVDPQMAAFSSAATTRLGADIRS